MGKQIRHIGLAALLAAAPVSLSGIAAQDIALSANAAQTLPAISGQALPARDAATFAEDLSLTNSCIDSGAQKTVCLCVTRVLKYELSLNQYRAATRLYETRGDGTNMYSRLQREGFAPADIQKAETVSANLTRNADFMARCADAKSYFETTRPKRR